MPQHTWSAESQFQQKNNIFLSREKETHKLNKTWATLTTYPPEYKRLLSLTIRSFTLTSFLVFWSQVHTYYWSLPQDFQLFSDFASDSASNVSSVFVSPFRAASLYKRKKNQSNYFLQFVSKSLCLSVSRSVGRSMSVSLLTNIYVLPANETLSIVTIYLFHSSDQLFLCCAWDNSSPQSSRMCVRVLCVCVCMHACAEDPIVTHLLLPVSSLSSMKPSWDWNWTCLVHILSDSLMLPVLSSDNFCI